VGRRRAVSRASAFGKRDAGGEDGVLIVDTSEPEWECQLSNAPVETPLSTFVRISGIRWPIETCFAECKGELGMDH
jgi:SRSO17 transposase